MTDEKAKADWTRKPLKAHVLTSLQALTRLRGDMLKALQPGGDTEQLALVLVQIGDHLAKEGRWLDELGGVPLFLRGSKRADLMRQYGQGVVSTLQTLAQALEADIRAPGAWDRATADGKPEGPARRAFLTFGQTLLGLISLQPLVRQL